MRVVIPRILHQIWLGRSAFPGEFAAYRETWRNHHPGWKLELWTEENLPGDLRRPEVYERLRVPAERADILRLELLWRFGGVYVDTDFECRRSLEPLIQDIDFFTAYLKPGRVNNAIIGATAGHPILDRALTELRPVQTYGYDKEAAGPLFLDRLIKDYPEAAIFEPSRFYPATPGERRRAIAIHHAARSWKDAAGFRRAVKRARSRTHETESEIAFLRRDLARIAKQISVAEARLERGSLGSGWRATTEVVLSEVREKVRSLARHTRRRAEYRVRALRAQLASSRDLANPILDVARLGSWLGVRRRPTSLPNGVPRVVHHIWLEPDPAPGAVKHARRSWLRNRGWQQRIWTDANLPEPLVRCEAAEVLRPPRERAAFLRLELLYRFGGIVVEPEVVCHAPIEPHLAGAELIAATEVEGGLDDSVLAAVPGHPVIEQTLQTLPATEEWGDEPPSSAAWLTARASAIGARIVPVPPTAVGSRGREIAGVRADGARHDALTAEAALAETQAGLERLRRERDSARARLEAMRHELLLRRHGRGITRGSP